MKKAVQAGRKNWDELIIPDAGEFKDDPVGYIWYYMKKNGVTIEDISEKLDMHRSAFSNILHGKRRMPIGAIRIAVRELGFDANIMLAEFDCERH